jgi:hypothetical protein
MIEARFYFEKETTLAVRYQEVNKDGQVVEWSRAKIGTIHVRKDAFHSGPPFPRELRVTIEATGAADPQMHHPPS